MTLKQWVKPELEVLEVSMTELHLRDGYYTDATYPANTPKPDIFWKS
ncbi:paeninodin family lasso peptide [Paenibacillus sp. MCAF9]